MNRYFIAVIRQYRRYVSPFLPQACRFTPSCSEYAIEAFEKKSALMAIWMTVLRLAKCHPFHPGGYDPVDTAGTSDRHGRDDIAVPLPSTACDGRNKS